MTQDFAKIRPEPLLEKTPIESPPAWPLMITGIFVGLSVGVSACVLFYLSGNVPPFNTNNTIESSATYVEEEQFTPIEERKAWQTGHAAETGDFLNGYEIEVGLVSLSMLKNWGIVGNILAGDICLQPEFLKRDRGRPHYLAFSQFPPTTKDLAILVDSNVLAGKVKLDLEKIAHACINDEFELESVSVFDLYEGRELPKDKKSLAFSLVFRSLERTLTDLEVNRIFGEIQKNISEHTDYKVRS